MKTHIRLKFWIIILIIIGIQIPLQSESQETVKFFIAIEYNGVVCGYSEIEFSDTIIDNKNYKFLNQETFANFHALGREISQHQQFDYIIDSKSGNFTYHKSYFKQGEMVMGGSFYVENDKIKTVSSNKTENISSIPAGTILPNTQVFTYLKNDFVDKKLNTQKYNVYDLRTGKIKEIEYTLLKEEEIELNDKSYDAIVLSEFDPTTGMTNKFWINKMDGIRLKMESPNKTNMYITDSSVPKRIKTGSWDDSFFIETNAKIDDIHGITYMKAKVKLEAIPNSTFEDLNVNGQQFSGNLNETFVDGEFIVSHKKYNGANAPAFPFDNEKYDIAKVYLESENSIESDDPELSVLAQKITKGSTNLWDATCKISNWVKENIDGSILDGSAKETLKQGSGLCGAQSRLTAALCRAAGIPARVCWGCLYIPKSNGSFGHHAWNEVFMGDAGWVPIDVTINESDFVNSGHIRLGILKTSQTTLNFEEITILEYK